jgi:HK97 family phage prohead protease
MNRFLKIDLQRAEGNTISAILSTDTPVERGGYHEILVHTEESITIRGNGNSLPLLTAHDSSEPAIGKVTDIHVSNGKLRGSLVFGTSQRAKELLEDIKARVIDGISIGYQILHKEMVGDTLRATNWEIFETSIVGVPADMETGFYRSQHKEKNMDTMMKFK